MPPGLSSQAVALTGLFMRFATPTGSLEVLQDVSLVVRPGEFVSIIGPSGCGKSTLLRIVGGLVQPSAGQVLIGGALPAAAQADKAIGFVFQDPSLLPWRTVLANVRLPLEVNRAGQRRPPAEPDELLRLVALADFARSYPHQLSGGMRQRVALARALVFRPSLLLMDEPFGALDEITRAAMRYELLRIWETARPTVLFVTHSIAEAVLLSDRIAVLSQRPGRLRAILPVPLSRPRDESVEDSPEFQRMGRELKEMLRE